MKITPLDIQHKTFRTALRGYHEEEVDKFLDEVAGELERLFTENSELKERLEKNKDKLTEYKKMEQTLHNTLLTAQRLADEIKGSAEREAAAAMQDAGAKSREILETAVRQREELLLSIDRLRKAEEQFRMKLRSVLDTYYEFIDRTDQVVRPEFFEPEEQLGQKVTDLLAGPELSPEGATGDSVRVAPPDPQPLPAMTEAIGAAAQPAVAVPPGMEISGRPAPASFGAFSETGDDAPTRESLQPVDGDALVTPASKQVEGIEASGSPAWDRGLEAEAPGPEAEGRPAQKPFIGFYNQDDGPAKADFSDLGEGVPGALRRARQSRQEEERPLAVSETD